MCACLRERRDFLCIPHNVIVNNEVAFRCIFTIEKSMVNQFSGNMSVGWVFR